MTLLEATWLVAAFVLGIGYDHARAWLTRRNR